jgi:allophanate hydrolase subunit 2
MPQATILSRYNFCTVQDTGRLGYRKFGVPIGGPMSVLMARYTNQLLGNNENDSVLEIFRSKFTLLFSHDCFIALSPNVSSYELNNISYDTNHIPIKIKANDILTIPQCSTSTWKYIAIKNGWQTEVVLNSRCTNEKLDMQKLTHLSLLPYKDNQIVESLSKNTKFVTENKEFIRIKKTKEFFHYEKHLTDVSYQNFTLSTQSNRKAYLLNEKFISDIFPYKEIQSRGVFPGCIQLTPSGHIYILMNDCQTTGGYPIIGYIDQDLEDLAQYIFNKKIKFKFIQ